MSAHLLPPQGPWSAPRPPSLTHCPLGASSAAVARTLCTPAPGPSSRQIYPAQPYLQGPGAPGPLFALGRGTCWADVGFPRPPSQRSQTREGAPWRLVLTARGKLRRRVASSSAFWPSHCPPPILPTHRKGARPSAAACGWAVRVSIPAPARVCVLQGQPHRERLLIRRV